MLLIFAQKTPTAPKSLVLSVF